MSPSAHLGEVLYESTAVHLALVEAGRDHQGGVGSGGRQLLSEPYRGSGGWMHIQRERKKDYLEHLSALTPTCSSAGVQSARRADEVARQTSLFIELPPHVLLLQTFSPAQGLHLCSTAQACTQTYTSTFSSCRNLELTHTLQRTAKESKRGHVHRRQD